MTYDGKWTWTYNALLQATRVTASTVMDMTYNYSASHDNGQIASSVDAITGETITYQYDALKRLLQASGKNWGESYVYDGYGNLTQMNPSGSAGAPTLNVSVQVDGNNVPTNRITATGVTYDNNGNLTAGFGGMTLYYDAANRVKQATLGGRADITGTMRRTVGCIAGMGVGMRRSTFTGWMDGSRRHTA